MATEELGCSELVPELELVVYFFPDEITFAIKDLPLPSLDRLDRSQLFSGRSTEVYYELSSCRIYFREVLDVAVSNAHEFSLPLSYRVLCRLVHPRAHDTKILGHLGLLKHLA